MKGRALDVNIKIHIKIPFRRDRQVVVIPVQPQLLS
jgi:hypothetical protein